MGSATFVQTVTGLNRQLRKYLCVGLDANCEHAQKVVKAGNTADSLVQFTREVVAATKHVACVYKPNIWFALDQLEDGWRVLCRIVENILEQGMPVIVDAKPGDIGNTTQATARALFDVLGASAGTANGYVGGEGLQPLFDRQDRGVFVLCRTSNPGGSEFQDQMVIMPWRKFAELLEGPVRQTAAAEVVSAFEADGGNVVLPFYQVVALRAANHWNKNGNLGLVVGATHPEELHQVRALVGPDMPLLVPGVGTQEGDLKASVTTALGKNRQGVFVVNVSRKIYQASTGSDFAEAAGRAAEEYDEEIRRIGVAAA